MSKLTRGPLLNRAECGVHLDIVDVKCVFSVLSWQHNEDGLGARPSEIDELHRKVSRVSLDTRRSCTIR